MAEMKNYDTEKMKKVLRNYLIELYKEKGLNVAKNKIMEFLQDSNKDADEVGVHEVAGHFRGELCENLLEIYLMDYVSKHKDTFIVKGLCFEKENGQGYTEMDLTLFTKARIYFFECKSYMGEKTLTDRCTINRKKYGSHDVFSQSKLHIDNFIPKVKYASCRNPNSKVKPMKIIYFGLSLDKTIDKRTKENQESIPFLHENNIEEYLKSTDSLTTVNWKIKELYDIVYKLNQTSNAKFKKHVKIMQEKHGNK